MADVPASLEYPPPSLAALKLEHVGRNLRHLRAPAVVVDAAVTRQNCKYMLDTVKNLDVGFRAHVKTHKTVEAAKLQVGDESKDIRLLCSTVAEAEWLVPWLLEARLQGKAVNIIYGLPVAPSTIPRFARIAHTLGPGSVTLMVDHPRQVKALAKFAAQESTAWPGPISTIVKIDAGYHRAGIKPKSPILSQISAAVLESPHMSICGIYCHMGHSYSSSSPSEALSFLRSELTEAVAGAEALLSTLPERSSTDKLIISIGATPTATATQNLHSTIEGSEVAKLIAATKERFHLEIHAGVYPFLDMQQMATFARPATLDSKPRLTTDNIAIRVMTEIASVYEDREKPEALIAAGSIVLGREPCKSYPGWGVVTPWRETKPEEYTGGKVYDPSADKAGWIVGRISQEHGVLTWEGPPVGVRQLEVGERVMVWPNHACMAGPNFGWYYVVDSEKSDGETVVDIWVRCRGW